MKISIRERIQIILAYFIAIGGIGLLITLALSVLELVPHQMQVDFGGFVFITSPILAIISGINFAIFNMFHKSSDCTSTMRKRFQIAFVIAFVLGILPFGLIITDIALFGF